MPWSLSSITTCRPWQPWHHFIIFAALGTPDSVEIWFFKFKFSVWLQVEDWGGVWGSSCLYTLQEQDLTRHSTVLHSSCSNVVPASDALLGSSILASTYVGQGVSTLASTGNVQYSILFSLNWLYSWFKPNTCCNASQHYSRLCHCTENYPFLLQLLTWLWEEWLLFQGLHRQTLILVLLYLAYLGTIDPTNLFLSISYFLILCKDSSGVLHK